MNSEIKSTSKIVYEIALKTWQKNIQMTPEKVLIYSIVNILKQKENSIKILGDAYLDYLNYKKEIEKGNLEKFVDFFEELYGSNNKEKNKNRIYELMKSPKKQEISDMLIAYKLMKQYFTKENFNEYVKLKKLD